MSYHRSLLFAPASSARKVAKAFESAADGVILDLEDAVAVSEKPTAREAAAEAVRVPPPRPAYVRVNATTTSFCFQDILAVTLGGLTGIVLPKVESAKELQTVDWVMAQLEAERGLEPNSREIMPIVETAKGLKSIDEIAAAVPRVRRLAFGAVDLALDMDVDLDDDAGAIAQARFLVARASRAAGIASPLDTAFIDIQDGARLQETAMRARALGYSGKSCIHPSQIEIVNRAFSPSSEELERAQRIVTAFERAEMDGLAAISVDGQMIDYPVFEKARNVLSLWARIRERR